MLSHPDIAHGHASGADNGGESENHTSPSPDLLLRRDSSRSGGQIYQVAAAIVQSDRSCGDTPTRDGVRQCYEIEVYQIADISGCTSIGRVDFQSKCAGPVIERIGD